MSDDWKSSVDTQLKNLRDDVVQIRNWLVGAIAVPLLAIVGLYVYNGSKFDRIDGKFEAVNQRIGEVQASQARVEGKLDILIGQRNTPRTASKTALPNQ